jgi:DNA primase
VLSSIAEIPDELDRQVYVQHLHQQTQQYRKGSDRELFQQLDSMLGEKRDRRRFEFRRTRSDEPGKPLPDPDTEPKSYPGKNEKTTGRSTKRPFYEFEIIRLLLTYDENMRKFIGHNIGEDHFEDEDIRAFYADIMRRHIEDKEISPDVYMKKEKPYPSLLSDIMMNRHTVSEKFAKRTGSEYRLDRNPIRTAKSAMKPLRLFYCERKRTETSYQIAEASGDEKEKLMNMLSRLQKEITRIKKTPADELFEDPEFLKGSSIERDNSFSYKMKNERK